jgi:succinate dehydrogenase/fumarate reductase flavoprotein subunit
MIYDVLVVGGGIAGLMAAIEAKKLDNRVAIVSKGNIFKSNSSMASGGINAVLDSEDRVEIEKHIEDTIKGAKGLADKKAATYLCKEAGRVVCKLHEYGVAFDTKDDGTFAQRSFGGGSSKRTCYVGDKTGGAITAALIKKAKEVGVKFLVNNYVMNLAVYKGAVSGIVALRRADSSVVVYPAKSVVLAGGGYAGIYKGFSTNAPDYTGDTLAIALRAGLELRDMEFVQFHPTGFQRSGYLVSEAARGEGGYIVNSDGERFVNELDTRDVVARAISEQINSGKKVFLDLRHLDGDLIEQKLPSLYRSAHIQAGVDIKTELLEIKPVAHYTMGGIDTDMTQTAIKGLFACGENSVTGAHGANRLGGNSLLEGAVFGELAGTLAFRHSQNTEFMPINYNEVVKDIEKVEQIFDGETTKNFNAIKTSMGNYMFKNVGIVRDETSLFNALNYISYLRRESATLHCIHKEKTNNVELVAILELRNSLEVAESIVMSALKREESRGSHYRVDFPQTSTKFEDSFLVSEYRSGYYNIRVRETGIKNVLKKLFTNLK